MVDLKATPFNLDDDAVAWVNNTIANMTDEEKIGQLFVNMGASRDEAYLKGVLDTYHIGAVRYIPAKAEEVWEQNNILQTNSKIPMLIAANTEAGGNGACTDGTYVGWEAKIGATWNVDYAYELGRISGIEASAIGCNWSFAPIVDVLRNWRNPIVSRRTWGGDVDQVLKMSLAYMRGIRESGIAPAAKHWPGDGIDERLHDALIRILGLKAMLGLHLKPGSELLPPKEEAMARIGLPESKQVTKDVADAAITLVKDKQPENLPISPERFGRILVVPIGAAPSPFAALTGDAGAHPADKLAEKLRERGYQADRYESQLDKVRGKSNDEIHEILADAYAGKSPISDLTDSYDMVISVANIIGIGQAIERPYWPGTKGTLDMPWYVHELPTILVSTASPNLLPDMPQVKTFINAFDDKDSTLEALLDKLEGKSEFKGRPNTDLFPFPDTRI